MSRNDTLWNNASSNIPAIPGAGEAHFSMEDTPPPSPRLTKQSSDLQNSSPAAAASSSASAAKSSDSAMGR